MTRLTWMARMDQTHDDHRAWRDWRVWRAWCSWAYAMGITAGGGTSFQHCCRQTWNRWRGRRSYILGLRRERWGCLLLRHHIASDAERYGVHCGICLPCPDCGATVWYHDCHPVPG